MLLSTILGDVADMDFGDPYQSWIAIVKAQGATVVGNPLEYGSYQISKGAPMARYPIATAQGLGLVNPDIVSGSGKYWYFVAPPDVTDFFFLHDMSPDLSPEAVKKGTDLLEPSWFKGLSEVARALTVVAVVGGSIYGVQVLSTTWKARTRPNPQPRRRR